MTDPAHEPPECPRLPGCDGSCLTDDHLVIYDARLGGPGVTVLPPQTSTTLDPPQTVTFGCSPCNHVVGCCLVAIMADFELAMSRPCATCGRKLSRWMTACSPGEVLADQIQ